VLTSGTGFFDQPWPSERRTVDGKPDLCEFPGVEEFPILQSYMDEAETLDGFGNNSPIFMRTDAPLDTSLLPEPEESMDPSASLFLINIDPSSPDRGMLTAVQWDFQQSDTRWQPENLLAVQPVWGMPLRPRTRYALVLTTDIVAKAPLFESIWHRSSPDYAEWKDLADTLQLRHIDQDRVAMATQFSTQDSTGEMARLVYRVQEGMETDSWDQEMEFLWSNQWYSAWRGQVRVPIFQHGQAPYLTEGGGFEFDESGWPVLAAWEWVDLVISVPDAEEPEDGWPVVLYVHGTGGNALGFASGNTGLAVASLIAGAGAVGVGISLPFHGDRDLGVDPALVSFNYFNASAGRSNFRHAALEQIWLIENLANSPFHFWGDDSDEEESIDLHTNSNAVAYMGHSHGGELGVIAAPFLGRRVDAMVISGAGGGLSISAVHRSAEDYPIQDLLRETFDFDEDEELDELHPLIGMIQFVAEATDPLNYGPYWHRWRPNWESTPVNLLMFEGLDDVYTPPAAIEALAGASYTPIISPVEQQSLVQELQQIDGIVSPVSGNIVGWDGESYTGGLAQYSDQGHFAIFNDTNAARRYRDFLATSLYDQPIIGNGED